MTWQELLAARQIRTHQTSAEELSDLRAIVARDLADAKVPTISPDRRFATAYNAVLQLTKMVIACEGYQVVGLGHHRTTFVALENALGPLPFPFGDYFDGCRKKRNQVDYDTANVTSAAEVDELLRRAEEFRRLVETWIRKHHSAYMP
jgi:hypothetical protein